MLPTVRAVPEGESAGSLLSPDAEDLLAQEDLLGELTLSEERLRGFVPRAASEADSDEKDHHEAPETEEEKGQSVTHLPSLAGISRWGNFDAPWQIKSSSYFQNSPPQT